MARTIKIDNAILKRFLKEETKRKQDIKPLCKYFLIVCEGEKTEKFYFESLKKDLPKGKIEIIGIEGVGKNTKSVVEDAKMFRTKYESDNYPRKLDQTWAVFDRDSFPKQNFNNAIFDGENSNPKIHSAWSNEAFELWFLLHFHFYNTALSREQYKALIENCLSEKMEKDFVYEKNSTEMYELLKKYGNQNDAIKFAKKLVDKYENQKDYANQNPCTKVYELIEELFEKR